MSSHGHNFKKQTSEKIKYLIEDNTDHCQDKDQGIKEQESFFDKTSLNNTMKGLTGEQTSPQYDPANLNQLSNFEINLDSILFLNDQSYIGPGASIGRPQNSSGLGNSENHDGSQETIIPSNNIDPPITIEEALDLISGSPDKYAIRNLYLTMNLMSMLAFMVSLSSIFMFAEPQVECLNSDTQYWHRCYTTEACSSTDFRVVETHSIHNFISTTQSLCTERNLNGRDIFSLMSVMMIISNMLSGYFLDRFGRKLVITIKAIGLLGSLVILLILGFIPSVSKYSLYSLFFIAIFFSTLTFDLVMLGFEQLPKEKRENFIILIQSTRIIGVALVCSCFSFLNNWTYFIIILAGLLAICLGFFIKFTLESPCQIMASTGSEDICKSILNKMAAVNEEDNITEKIAFSLSQAQIKKRRTFRFQICNLFDNQGKQAVIGVLSVAWLAYLSSQMLHFVFLENLQSNLVIDSLILGSAEFLAALSSKFVMKFFGRRLGIFVSASFVTLNFVILCILKDSKATIYTTTILSRAGLQVLFNLLQIATLEQFPTEVRGIGTGFVMSIGCIGGVGLPFIQSLDTPILLIVILLMASTAVGILFLRETKSEYQLRNLYSEIFPTDFSPIQEQKLQPAKKGANVSIFDEILKDLKEEGNHDRSNSKDFFSNQMLFNDDGQDGRDQDADFESKYNDSDQENGVDDEDGDVEEKIQDHSKGRTAGQAQKRRKAKESGRSSSIDDLEDQSIGAEEGLCHNLDRINQYY